METSSPSGTAVTASRPGPEASAAQAPRPARSIRRSRFWFPWLTTFTCLLLVGTAWAVALPVFSGGDEYAHAVQSEAVFTGQFLPPLTPNSTSQFESGLVHTRVPLDGSGCYIGQVKLPATCDTTSLTGGSPSGTAKSYVSREPPLPALLNGLPFYLSPTRTGLYLSRILNAAVVAALLATAFAFALSRRRTALVAGVTVGATPTLISQSGVVGSSPLEIATALVLWVLLVLLLDERERGPRIPLLFAGFGSFLVLLRPVSFVYLAVLVAALLILMPVRRLRTLLSSKAVLGGVAVLTLATVGALAWYAFATAPVTPGFLESQHVPVLTSWTSRIVAAANGTYLTWAQMIGTTGSGEYNGPDWLLVVWTLLAGGVVGIGLLFGSRRRVLAVGGLVAVLFCLPVAAQAITVPRTWLYWSGRYNLPIYAGIVVVAISAADGRLRRVPELRRLAPFVLVLAGALQVVDFYATLRRYAVGIDASFFPLRWGNGWHPVGLPAVVLLCLGVAVLVLTYAGLVWQCRALPPEPAPEPVEPEPAEAAALSG
jgi:Predicted membrane protein (DUF2142)